MSGEILAIFCNLNSIDNHGFEYSFPTNKTMGQIRFESASYKSLSHLFESAVTECKTTIISNLERDLPRALISESLKTLNTCAESACDFQASSHSSR